MTLPRLQRTARLDSRGLAKVLGDLEAKVMSAVWRTSAPASARTIHDRVVRDHPVKLLTVVTVLNKLVAKRLLKRSTIDGLLHYSARQTRAEFDAFASRRLVEGVLGFSRDLVAASLVDVLAETDPEALEELSRLVKARLKEQKER
ncbi:MAG: BlaI/MecI/CopY family transcriptional regulator [Gemmatimonadota bacterium]|nr:BlaI/MecI/CopY family transcriptional regulator [Gemmatimonadota bacterium]